MENTILIKLRENNEMTVYRHVMSEIKINDFWAWLNRFIPNSESLKLIDICDCDYKRQMIRKYSKLRAD